MARVSHPTWRSNSANAWIGIVFGIPFLCVGLIVLAIGLKSWQWARDSVNWSTADAKVLAQKYVLGGRGSTGHTQIRCEFKTRDGRTITANRSLEGHRQELSTVIIYYDPNHPERSLLEPEGAKFIGQIATLVGTASTAGGAFLIVYGVFTIRKHKRENRLFEQKRAEDLERRAHRSV